MRMIRLNKNSLFFSFILSPNWRTGKEVRERNWGNKIDFPHAGCFFVFCVDLALIKRLFPPALLSTLAEKVIFLFIWGGEIAGRTERQKNNLFPPSLLHTAVATQQQGHYTVTHRGFPLFLTNFRPLVELSTVYFSLLFLEQEHQFFSPLFTHLHFLPICGS